MDPLLALWVSMTVLFLVVSGRAKAQLDVIKSSTTNAVSGLNQGASTQPTTQQPTGPYPTGNLPYIPPINPPNSNPPGEITPGGSNPPGIPKGVNP